MKTLLVSVNSKFIHTNLAIRSLRAYALNAIDSLQIEIGEWNINSPTTEILQGIYEKHADVILFSVYIWNVKETLAVADDLHKIIPEAIIGLGGPEVSYRADSILKENPCLDLIMTGEGEETFLELEKILQDDKIHDVTYSKQKDYSKNEIIKSLHNVKGLYLQKNQGDVFFTGERDCITNLDNIPFAYGGKNLAYDPDPKSQFVYYESSRGCPFSCAYCLSSIDRNVRHLSLKRVKSDLLFFMQKQYKIVKFVDRTFNLLPEHYLGIWKFIIENWNQKTIFHFEIAGGILPEEAFSILKQMPHGAIQFEIGIQSTNPDTLKAVNRSTDTTKLAENIKKIPNTIPVHLDLIAGLPHEDFCRFGKSFDFAFGFLPQMLQLGFLKVLFGSKMHEIAESSNFMWSQNPPYEILATPLIKYDEMSLLKKIDKVMDIFYNSQRFSHLMKIVLKNENSAFNFFCELTNWLDTKIEANSNFSLLETQKRPTEQFNVMFNFLKETNRLSCEWIETLRFDFLLEGKPGQYPAWFEHRYTKASHEKALAEVLQENVNRRIGFSLSEYEEFNFLTRNDVLKIDGGFGKWKILFTYENTKHKKKDSSAEKKSSQETYNTNEILPLKKTEEIFLEKTEKIIQRLLQKKVYVISQE